MDDAGELCVWYSELAVDSQGVVLGAGSWGFKASWRVLSSGKNSTRSWAIWRVLVILCRGLYPELRVPSNSEAKLTSPLR